MSDPVYNTAKWKRVRLEVLERDRYVCKLQFPGCTVIGDTVDHTIPWREDPSRSSWYRLDMLKAACRHCNSVRSNQKDRPAVLNPSREW